MPFYSPTFLVPNSNEEVISSTPTLFSWAINGTSNQVAYEIFIRQNDDNVEIYDSTKITSNLGEHLLPASICSAGTQYKWKINSYYDRSNYTESNWEIFYAIGIPSVALSSTPTVSQNYTFESTYYHPQNVGVKTYIYNLYLTSDLSTIISTSGEIYPATLVIDPTTPLTHEFEGLVTSVSYTIECIVFTQNDFEITTGKIAFTVTYSSPENTDYIVLTPIAETGAISISWANLKSIVATTTGTYEYLSPFTYSSGSIGEVIEEYISPEIDVIPPGFDRVSTFTVDATLYPGTHLLYYTRYTSDGITWSAWESTTNASNILSTIGKYIKKIQYKLLLVGEY